MDESPNKVNCKIDHIVREQREAVGSTRWCTLDFKDSCNRPPNYRNFTLLEKYGMSQKMNVNCFGKLRRDCGGFWQESSDVVSNTLLPFNTPRQRRPLVEEPIVHKVERQEEAQERALKWDILWEKRNITNMTSISYSAREMACNEMGWDSV